MPYGSPLAAIVATCTSVSNKSQSCTLLSHKDEFAGRGLKRWRDVQEFSRIWGIARWAGSYIVN
jgi:hypothetical protein